MKRVAVVLAGGKGSRMKMDLPKQYMEILGKPMIYYSLAAFQNSPIDEIILVTGDSVVEGMEEADYCKSKIIDKYGLTKVTAIIGGGKERYNSVYNALCHIGENGGCDYVYIHDGARPCINSEVIERCINDAEKYKASVAAMPVKDTIKVADSQGYAKDTPDRSTLWMIQTPQSFEYTLAKTSYDKMIGDENRGNITDDAMVVEHYSSVKVRLTEGSYENLKVTTPEDKIISEIFLKKVVDK